jgi:hypothetical protein
MSPAKEQLFIPEDLDLQDPELFLSNIPHLIQSLKIRDKNLTWNLNFSIASIAILDEYIQDYISILLKLGTNNFSKNYDRKLIFQVVAYMGELIKRNNNGRWSILEKNNQNKNTELVIVYIIKNNGSTIERVCSVFEKVEAVLLEGERLADWYKDNIL